MSWGLIGHEWAVKYLREQIIRQCLHHAYLITGPEGIGRRTLALRFAQALNCPSAQSPGEPCGKCQTCDRIWRMGHPDLAVVQADQKGGTLKVEQIRELQHSLALAPYQADYRVALLLRFEEAHESAANALLKTLEEPQAKVVLILTAENAESLPATIVSRCETLRLRSLPVEMVMQGLTEAWGIPEEEARLLAHISDGRPGYALNLFQQAELMEQRRTCLEEHISLLTAPRVERFGHVLTLTKEKNLDKETLLWTLQLWGSFWRDVLLEKSGARLPLTNLDFTLDISRIAERLSFEQASQAVSSIQRAVDMLMGNVNIRLLFEVLWLDIPAP